LVHSRGQPPVGLREEGPVGGEDNALGAIELDDKNFEVAAKTKAIQETGADKAGSGGNGTSSP